MPRLFTKFATKSESGIGLGLFISKSIIEAHGGMIWAENNSDGAGSSFYFLMPILSTKIKNSYHSQYNIELGQKYRNNKNNNNNRQ